MGSSLFQFRGRLADVFGQLGHFQDSLSLTEMFIAGLQSLCVLFMTTEEHIGRIVNGENPSELMHPFIR